MEFCYHYYYMMSRTWHNLDTYVTRQDWKVSGTVPQIHLLYFSYYKQVEGTCTNALTNTKLAINLVSFFFGYLVVILVNGTEIQPVG